MPCSKIEDPHGDIAGALPAAGYGRFRFHPNIIPRIIINNISIRKLRENRAPKARREKQAARQVLTSRAAMLMSEGKKILLTVMITHREDIDLDHFIVHRVNDAMFSIDTPRPLPGQIILQGFWLTDTGERMFRYIRQ